MPLALPEFDRAVFEKVSGVDPVSSEIGAKECAKLREAFRNVSVDGNPAKWQTYGYLSLYKGRTLLVRFMLFQDQASIGPFKYDGKYHRGYDQPLFRSLDWERIPGSIPKQLESFHQPEKLLDFSAATPLSESYNLPRP